MPLAAFSALLSFPPGISSASPAAMSGCSHSSAHLFAAHPAAGHLEVVLTEPIGAQQVLGARLEQRTHRLL